jgi:hypothetical protein
MYKYFFLTLFFVSTAFCQTTINKIIKDQWDCTKNKLFESLNEKNYEEKEAMGYTGFVVVDTISAVAIDLGYFFNSNNIQSLRAISNHNKTDDESKVLFEILFSSLQKLLGDPKSNNESFGTKMVIWKDDSLTIMLNHNSNTCMMSLIK